MTLSLCINNDNHHPRRRMEVVPRGVRAKHLESFWQTKNVYAHPFLQKYILSQPNALPLVLSAPKTILFLMILLYNH